MFQSPQAVAARNLDPYLVPQVTLAPVSDEQQTDENLEPPYIRLRSANAGFLHLDGGFEDANSQTPDNASFTIGTQLNRLYTRKIQRFSVAGLQSFLATPNINPRNNVVIYETVPAAGGPHVATIPEGWYTALNNATADSALTALQNALNAAVPPPPAATFTVLWARGVTPAANPLQAIINTGGGFTFRFSLNTASTMLFKGKNLFNLPADQTFTAIKTLGAAFLIYSRYLDICSSALTRYTKNPTASNQGPFNLYARIYLQSPLVEPSVPNPGGFPTMGGAFAAFQPSIESTNFRRDRAFESVDITFRDEFGDPFYIPSLATGTLANVDPSLVLLTEI